MPKENEDMFEFLMKEMCSSDAYWTLSKRIVKILGLETTMFLTQLIDWESYLRQNGRLEKGGWFYHTCDDITEQTTLSRYAQTRAITLLQEMGVLQVVSKGLPKRQWFKITLNSSVLKTKLQCCENATQASRKRNAYNEEHNNEVKEKYKKEKTPKIQLIELFPISYQEHETFQQVWSDFVADRKERKIPLTERATKLIVNKFRRDCKKDIQSAIDALQVAIERGYRGVFPKVAGDALTGTKTHKAEPTKPKGPRVGCDPHERF